MKVFWTVKIVFFSLVFLSTTFSQKAHAYLDPGTGSFVMQIIVSTLIGALFAVKLFWVKSITFFKNLYLKKRLQKSE